MIDRIVSEFRDEGFSGACHAIARTFVPGPPPIIHPIRVALDEITGQNGFTVVQLGAFIGNTENDPLFETLSKQLQHVKGTLIVVEPVRSFFEQLVKNYEGIPGIIFENVAISDHNGIADFYRLGVDPVEHGYPAWLSQLGSLKQQRMESLWDQYERNPEFKAFYLRHRVKESVSCRTLEELARRHQVKNIDLLQIDVEGYELEILSTVNFVDLPVRFVNYESVLLHRHKRDAERLMRGHGYRLVDYGQDTFCYKLGDKQLASRWNRRPNIAA